MASTAPTKLMIVRNEAKAAELRKVMGDDWYITGFYNALTDRRFDLILLVDQPERNEKPDQWLNYINTRVKTKLSLGGKLIEVY